MTQENGNSPCDSFCPPRGRLLHPPDHEYARRSLHFVTVINTKRVTDSKAGAHACDVFVDIKASTFDQVVTLRTSWRILTASETGSDAIVVCIDLCCPLIQFDCLDAAKVTGVFIRTAGIWAIVGAVGRTGKAGDEVATTAGVRVEIELEFSFRKSCAHSDQDCGESETHFEVERESGDRTKRVSVKVEATLGSTIPERDGLLL
jgi:hypothetical protein